MIPLELAKIATHRWPQISHMKRLKTQKYANKRVTSVALRRLSYMAGWSFPAARFALN
jgi:hypothetical protein